MTDSIFLETPASDPKSFTSFTISSRTGSLVVDGGGLRFNDGKPRYDLIPPEALDALAAHFAVGAKKYAERNWERGMSWGHCFAGLMRHSWAFWRGEEFDSETGTHHMVSAMWNCVALFTYWKRGIGEDTRLIDEGQKAQSCSSYTGEFQATDNSKQKEN